MEAHLSDTHLLVPRSRSSAKVKVEYQGHVSQKMGVPQTQLVFKTTRSTTNAVFWGFFNFENIFLQHVFFKSVMYAKGLMRR